MGALARNGLMLEWRQKPLGQNFQWFGTADIGIKTVFFLFWSSFLLAYLTRQVVLIKNDSFVWNGEK